MTEVFLGIIAFSIVFSMGFVFGSIHKAIAINNLLMDQEPESDVVFYDKSDNVIKPDCWK